MRPVDVQATDNTGAATSLASSEPSSDGKPEPCSSDVTARLQVVEKLKALWNTEDAFAEASEAHLARQRGAKTLQLNSSTQNTRNRKNKHVGSICFAHSGHRIKLEARRELPSDSACKCSGEACLRSGA